VFSSECKDEKSAGELGTLRLEDTFMSDGGMTLLLRTAPIMVLVRLRSVAAGGRAGGWWEVAPRA